MTMRRARNIDRDLQEAQAERFAVRLEAAGVFAATVLVCVAALLAAPWCYVALGAGGFGGLLALGAELWLRRFYQRCDAQLRLLEEQGRIRRLG